MQSAHACAVQTHFQGGEIIGKRELFSAGDPRLPKGGPGRPKGGPGRPPELQKPPTNGDKRATKDINNYDLERESAGAEGEANWITRKIRTT